MTEGMLKMMGVFAELKRNMTVQRIRSGMANARAKGKVIGRPRLTKDEIPPYFYKYYSQYKNGRITKVELARLCRVARSTVYRYLDYIEDVNI
jgi:DNA invertase Pin-like site-specific DNA recombinase